MSELIRDALTRHMLDGSDDVTLVLNDDRAVTIASRSVAQLGWTAADLIGTRWEDLLADRAPERAPDTGTGDPCVAGGARADRPRVRLRRRDGSTWLATAVEYPLDTRQGGRWSVVVLSDPDRSVGDRAA